jgi:diguanylate cyclase (GGDEF)-like protein
MFSTLKKYIKTYRELEYLAYHDLLTGTYNRNWLIKNIDMVECQYVYFIDINNLHQINEDKGHTEGDKVIKEVAEKLKVDGNIVVRYAGDEFVVFSDSSNLIKKDNLYSIGMGWTSHNFSVTDAIEYADRIMLINKKKLKENENKNS